MFAFPCARDERARAWSTEESKVHYRHYRSLPNSFSFRHFRLSVIGGPSVDLSRLLWPTGPILFVFPSRMPDVSCQTSGESSFGILHLASRYPITDNQLFASNILAFRISIIGYRLSCPQYPQYPQNDLTAPFHPGHGTWPGHCRDMSRCEHVNVSTAST